jgi:hypothetical protein
VIAASLYIFEVRGTDGRETAFNVEMFQQCPVFEGGEG